MGLQISLENLSREEYLHIWPHRDIRFRTLGLLLLYCTLSQLDFLCLLWPYAILNKPPVMQLR
jgi:hypothetical protein